MWSVIQFLDLKTWSTEIRLRECEIKDWLVYLNILCTNFNDHGTPRDLDPKGLSTRDSHEFVI